MTPLKYLTGTLNRIRMNSRGMASSGRTYRFVRFGVMLLLIMGVAIVVGSASIETGEAQQPNWRWYMTDTHVHTSVSSDAFADMGIHSDAATQLGYDAVFVTDHDGGSHFHINRMDANNMFFEDAYTRWEVETYGQLNSSINQLASSPVNTGTRSLRLEATAPSGKYGETMVWTKRGPNFRSGNIILKFSVYPTRIDSGSGMYVSVSIGGDPTIVKNPTGYTTQQGVVSPGKSTVLVWQIGNPRVPSTDPNARVLTYNLGSYQLNQWNHYEINVSNYLNDIPANDRPLDYNGLTHLKMAAAGNGGTVRGYFDTYSMTASSPVPAAQEFVYRTGVIDDFNTSTFKAFPGIEMGQQKHTNRLNFGITQTNQYKSYQFGSDGIIDTQITGYPAQLNHPGTTISTEEAIATLGHGADFLEVRDDPWIAAWDEILKQGRQIIGTWSSDSHNGVSGGRAATFIYAPELEFDPLVHSYFEGRVFNARNNFGGNMVLNLDGSSAPYPARYPVFVSPGQSAADVHLNITGGMNNTHKVNWFVNGSLFVSDTVSSSNYSAIKSIPLNGDVTYVRAEIRTSSGVNRAMTQPIFFIDVPDMPNNRTFNVDRTVNPDGNGYTVYYTKGITNSSWSSVDSSLTMTLENLPGALVTMHSSSPEAPSLVRVDGQQITGAGSLSSFNSATGSTWFYDGGTSRLYLKVKHGNATADVRVAFSDIKDTEPPTKPENLIASTISGNRVDLSWDESSDNIGVAGYDLYRNGDLLVSLGNVLTHSDNSVQPETTYTYAVVARDGGGNFSAPSDPATVTTGAEAIFSDGFELGDMSLWTSSSGVQVQGEDVFSGAYAARIAGNGTASHAYRQLASGHSELFYQMRFKVNSQGNNTVYLLRHRTATGGSIMGAFINNSGRLAYRNDVTGQSTTSGITVSQNVWHDLQVRVKINGNNGEIEVWYDGQRVDALSKTEAFGTNPIGRVQLGENATGRAFNITVDDVVVNTSFIGDGGGGNDTQPPTAPAGLTATAVSGSQIDLSWQASTDNVGVVGYNIYRNGELLVEHGAETSFADTSVASSTSYTYQVRGRDAAGNLSEPSNEAAATTPVTILFEDSFESGNMSLWNTSTGLVVQNQEVYVGSFAARATSTGTAAHAQKYLASGQSEVFYQFRFKIVSQANNNVYLMRNRTGTGGSIMGLYLNGAGRLGYRNDVTGQSRLSSLTVTHGQWHTIQVRVKIDGGNGQIEIWYDGQRIDELSAVENFGTNQIGRIQLGENASGRTFDFVFDEVIVDDAYIDWP